MMEWYVEIQLHFHQIRSAIEMLIQEIDQICQGGLLLFHQQRGIWNTLYSDMKRHN